MPHLSPNIVLGCVVSLCATLVGCSDKGGGDQDTLTISGGIPGIDSLTTLTTPGGGTDENPDATGTSAGTSEDPTSVGGDPGGDVKFDLGVSPDGGSVDPGEDPCLTNPNDPSCVCSIPDHTPCDNGTGDLFLAMGLNCPGELQVQGSSYGNPSAFGVRSNFGAGGTWNAREGAQYAVLGSGLVAELNQANDGDVQGPARCNDDLGGFDPGGSLPNPVRTNNVGGDCTQNLGLLGTGDCSNTIQGQFTAGGGANDYTELRFVLNVPSDVTSFSYDFAFFSTEYPYYYGSGFNDMYIGWLESEKWTGNISFDQQGNPISLNAGFLDHKDNPPALQNTCMNYHAGTNWLTSTASVTPGETITVVFAIFDLSDSILDSYVFLDNWQWGCEPSGKPTTMPPG